MSFQVQEGQAVSITPNHLSFSGVRSEEHLVYTITHPLGPHDGSLFHIDSPGLELRQFMQADINDMKIIYMPPLGDMGQEEKFFSFKFTGNYLRLQHATLKKFLYCDVHSRGIMLKMEMIIKVWVWTHRCFWCISLYSCIFLYIFVPHKYLMTEIIVSTTFLLFSLFFSIRWNDRRTQETTRAEVYHPCGPCKGYSTLLHSWESRAGHQ